MANTNIVEIIDAGVKIELERGCITNCEETADGISIQLATGTQILHANYHMPPETKRSIINAVKTFDKVKTTTIEFRNYRQPVSIKTN